MPNKCFLSHLKTQIGEDDSALRRNIANTVLRQKDSMQATTIIIGEVSKLASEQSASDIFNRLKNPSGDMLASISNAISYNTNSVTIAPSRPNSPSKSPKYIADKVLENMIECLRCEANNE